MKKSNKIVQDFDQQRYFDDDVDVQNPKQVKQKQKQEQQEQDPLDAFMRQMNDNPGELDQLIPKQQKLQQDDPVEQYLQHVKKTIQKQKKLKMKMAENQQQQSDESCEYINSDGEIDFEALKKRKKKPIQTLDPIDYSKIQLNPFQKNFYNQHEDITNMKDSQVKLLRKDWGMKVSGQSILKPVVSFGQLGFSQQLIDMIAFNMFEKPTPIQCQVLPICLSGRDVVGVAKTGSGKTLAYIWPLLIHVLDQPELGKNDGPIGLILAPTRQLCQQIYLQTKKYTKKIGIKVGCILGGQNKHEQWKILKAGVDILIASPGRLIEMIKKKATNLMRVTYLVIDQADKMFSFGFQQQLLSILSQTRQDRQTSLFTATLRDKVQTLVYDYLTYPAVIKIGQQNQANEDIQQQVAIVQTQQLKLSWLIKSLHLYTLNGKVLIFVNQIKSCEKLQDFMRQRMGLDVLILHGDKSQFERTDIINSFKNKKQMNILVATDVASRGLDVREIKTVINFEVPKDVDTYIHRIGRTGRAGDLGLAITLLTNTQHKFASQLIKVFEISSIPVPQDLQRLANTDQKYKKKRQSNRMGISFAKGKDVNKLLNRALKNRTNRKSGLGFSQNPKPPISRFSYSPPEQHVLPEQKLQLKNLNDKFSAAHNLSNIEDQKITITYNKSNKQQ